MATVIWGSDYPFAKIAMQEISPLSFSAARTLLATVALFPFFLKQESSWKVSRRDFLYLALLACFGTFLNRICWSVGLSLSTASNAALLMTTSPIFVLLTSVLLFRSSVTWRATLGILVAFAGVFLVIQGDFKGWNWSGESFLGDLILLVAAISWALFTALAKFLLKDHSSLKVTAYVMAIGSILFIPLLPNDKPGGWSEISALAWFSVFYVGLSGNCLAYFLWMKGIQNIGPLRTILYSYLMPITAIAFSIPLLGETITATQIYGGLIVFAGIFLARSG
jgi:drug/metabolite transporter (DMT)-like permease